VVPVPDNYSLLLVNDIWLCAALVALGLHPSLHFFRWNFLFESRNGPHVTERIREAPLTRTKEHVRHSA